MSMHESIVLIRGDHRQNLPQIFENFDYKVTSNILRGVNLKEASEAIQYPRPDKSRDLVHKAACFCNGWTVIIDPEMTLITAPTQCESIARRLGTSIFGILCEGASGTYGFWFFDPALRRAFLAVEGVVKKNVGTPIAEEEGINLISPFETDMLQLMARMGVSWEAIQACREFDVYELDESSTPPAKAEPKPQPKQPDKPPTPQVQKPWWKFW